MSTTLIHSFPADEWGKLTAEDIEAIVKAGPDADAHAVVKAARKARKTVVLLILILLPALTIAGDFAHVDTGRIHTSCGAPCSQSADWVRLDKAEVLRVAAIPPTWVRWDPDSQRHYEAPPAEKDATLAEQAVDVDYARLRTLLQQRQTAQAIVTAAHARGWSDLEALAVADVARIDAEIGALRK